MEWPEERRLIWKVRQGDREACTEVVRANYTAIYRLLTWLTRDAVLAEDLTQETFAIAWQKIGGFEGRASIRSWLHRIAYRKWIDTRREMTRRSGLTVARAEQDPVRVAVDPVEKVMNDERSRRLHTAIRELSEPDTVVITLHYFQGLSYHEMASVLDEPEGTVKSRTSEALKRLRGLLSEEPDHERQRKTIE